MTRYQPSADMQVEDVSGRDIELIFHEAMVHEGARSVEARISRGGGMDIHEAGKDLLEGSSLLGFPADEFRSYDI